ncbi:hypothetical protein BSKO_07767 [Bryopsis sp. KO-2023]|nr:hypothetical protein BSKO_07767 [Bryopsis sp. KO-2023]
MRDTSNQGYCGSCTCHQSERTCPWENPDREQGVGRRHISLILVQQMGMKIGPLKKDEHPLVSQWLCLWEAQPRMPPESLLLNLKSLEARRKQHPIASPSLSREQIKPINAAILHVATTIATSNSINRQQGTHIAIAIRLEYPEYNWGAGNRLATRWQHFDNVTRLRNGTFANY